MLIRTTLLLLAWAKADNSACPTFDLSKGSELDLDYVLMDSVVKQEPLLLVGLGEHSTPPPKDVERVATIGSSASGAVQIPRGVETRYSQ